MKRIEKTVVTTSESGRRTVYVRYTLDGAPASEEEGAKAMAEMDRRVADMEADADAWSREIDDALREPFLRMNEAFKAIRWPRFRRRQKEATR